MDRRDRTAAAGEPRRPQAAADERVADGEVGAPDPDRSDAETGPDAGADERSPLAADAEPAGAGREQADFRDRFDKDLYNDREDRPAQGNTADVAMGEQRFGSDADAYAEYAWRRPGDHHRGDESAVGQARDPADGGDTRR